MGFMPKGVPAKAVAAFAGPPGNMALLVGTGDKIKSVNDLAGKKIGVTTAGSLTYWLVPVLFRRVVIPPGLAKRQPYLFGLGASGFTLLMTCAGTLGAPRRPCALSFLPAVRLDHDTGIAYVVM